MRRVVLLTGRSDPHRTGLPPVQAAFLEAVTPKGAEALRDGFPWRGGPAERQVPLWRATVRNAQQWRAARSGRMRGLVAPRLAALRDGPVAFVTGSCGLDILACGWAPGAPALVIALGPVTRGRPALAEADLITVVGRRDGLSRAIHRAAPDHAVPCGHMGYWACAETRAVVAARLEAWAA